MRFKPIDSLTFAYFLLVSALIAVFHTKVQHWDHYLTGYGLYFGLIFFLISLHARFPKNRLVIFLRTTYPLIASALVYKSIEGYVLIFYPHFLDPWINRWEHAVFGEYPTLALEKIAIRPVNEYFMFVYFSYYFHIAIPPVILFIQKRYADLERLVFTLILAFYISYLGFVLVPFAGPQYWLKDAYTIKQLSGYFFTPLQQWLMAHGDAMGACFPSSHVAIAWVALFSIKRYFGKRIFWMIFPITVSLSVSVVYNRYHYVLDSLAGFLVGWACYQFSRWFYQIREAASLAKFHR